MRKIEIEKHTGLLGPTYLILLDGEPLSIRWTNPPDLTHFAACQLDVKKATLEMINQELQALKPRLNLTEEEITRIIELCTGTIK